MQTYPHHYRVSATGGDTGPVEVSTAGVPALSSAPPPEFDGPGGVWSPETLLTAALADCFVLTFRAVAKAAGFAWQHLHCEVEGTLERAEGVTRFTHFVTRVRLTRAEGSDAAKAAALLERSEKVCLIANSVSASRELVILPAT